MDHESADVRNDLSLGVVYQDGDHKMYGQVSGEHKA